MTRVDFYTRVADKLQTACSLCAKAMSRQIRVRVLTPDAETTDRLDKLLWSVPSIGFVPHVRARHRLSPVTPVIIDHDAEWHDRDELLVNLGPGLPAVADRFQRVMEIVTLDETDVSVARDRYRAYRQMGCEIYSHDLGSAAREA